jgi:pyruvate,water dikinase
MISAEPAKLAREMGTLLAQHPSTQIIWQEGTLPEAKRAMRDLPALEERVQNYLARFGERCVEELKLETVPLKEDPLPLFRAVAAIALVNTGNGSKPSAGKREDAEEAAMHRMRFKQVRRLIFSHVLKHARRHLRLRENLRMERTRVFGRVRSIFRAMGRRFVQSGMLADEEDIFFLTLDDITGAVRGNPSSTALPGLAAARKEEFSTYKSAPAPPDRLITIGPVAEFNLEQAPEKQVSQSAAGQIEGLGSCPGRVQGRVRVILDPSADRPRPGEILVAQRTDPGWVLLFPMAAGILVEFGSLLSHSAIVARELGLPAVVAIPDLTTQLATGDLVEMDGETGLVRQPHPES